jgi:hypothetical protein
VEDLPGVDLVGPELVGSLHLRRRERGREREGARARQAAKQARRRREWEWEDGTAAQQHLLLEPKPEEDRCGLSWGWARILEAHFELTEPV